MWKYDEKELREDVRTALPEHFKKNSRVYKVTSGDSDKKYWVYLMWDPEHKGIFHNSCDCPEGYHKALLGMVGIPVCKHVDNLLAFLREKERL